MNMNWSHASQIAPFLRLITRCISLSATGLIFGALSERIAYHNWLPHVLPSRWWNATIKFLLAYLTWSYLMLQRFENEEEIQKLSEKCALPITTMIIKFLFGHNALLWEEDCDGSTSDTQSILMMIFSLVHLLQRCVIFSIAARFGSSLQPVGITGGIACGKSTVTSLLANSTSPSAKDAFSVVDVDGIAHDILVPGKKGSDCGYRRVVEAFSGEDIFVTNDNSANKSNNNTIVNDCKNGIVNKATFSNSVENKEPLPIDRRKLGNIIFRDSMKRRKLNGITHPLISKIMMKEIVRENYQPSSKHSSSVVSVDIPLLFESGLKMKLLFGIKVMIACTPELQLKRLMIRNPDLTQEQCESRIQSQMPIDQKAKMADVVIWNNGTVEDLKKEVEIARKGILSRVQSSKCLTLTSTFWSIGFIIFSSIAFDLLKAIL